MQNKTKMLFALTFAALAVVACAFIVFNDDSAVAADNIIDVSTESDLSDAVKNPNNSKKTIRLASDIEVTNIIVVNQEITIDLNGKKLFNTSDIWDEAVGNWSLISVRDNGNLTIKGDGLLQAKRNDCFTIDLYDESTRCTINGGHYIGNVHAVYVQKGKLVINSGEFEIQQLYSDVSKGYEFVINCYDASYKSGIATVTINGGIYHGFNPQNNASEGAGTNHISADYAVIESIDVNPHEYTVVKAVATIDNMGYPTLEAAWNAAVSGDSNVVIDVVSDSKGNGLQIGDGSKFDKSVTLDLNGHKYEFTGGAVGSTGTVNQALHLNGGKDCKVIIKDGELIVGSPSSTSGIKLFCMNYVNLELNNVVVDLSGSDCIGIRSCEDTLTITGSTEFKMGSNKEAITNDMFSSHTDSSIIFDDNFKGTIRGNMYLWNEHEEGSTNTAKGRLEIKSGTFLGSIASKHPSSEDISERFTVGISGGSFTDIANAVKYATSGATITLAENVTLSSSIEVKKSVTIDLNGKTIESSVRVFNILDNGVIFTIDANDGSISTTETVVRTNNGYANQNVIVRGGTYSGDYVFVNYAQCGSFSIDKAVVNGKSAGIWFGNGPASNASITDSTIVATNNNGVGIYLGTVKGATLSNVKVTGGTGIEIKSGTVTIDGNSTVIGTAKYVAEEDMNNDGSGGSVAAICINNAYVDKTCTGVSRTDGVFVTIGKDVSVVSKNADEKKMCITSGHIHGGTVSVNNAPIFVKSKLSDKEVGTVFMSDCKSPIIYNGVAYAFNQDMYDVVKSDSNVNGYDISLAEGVKLTVGTVNGTVTLAKGAELTITKDSTFTGTINGPDNNKLVANGMKAGEGGIAITGGSLIINGKIMDASGLEAGVTVTVTGNAIKVEGTLESGATMVIEEGTVVTVENGKTFLSNGTVNNNGIIDNKGTITNDGVLTNDGTIKMTGESNIAGDKKVVNNGVVIDERAKDARAVPVTNDGTVVAKNNADKYKDAKVDVVEQDPDKPVATEGKIEVNTNKYAFITPVTTTGKLNIVMNDGYKQYTVTIPEGITIAAGTVISVSFIEYQSDSVTSYQINTPGIENFSMKLPCQIGFKKAKVYCDDSELGVSKVRYDAGTGYVTFDASHNSVFTIVLSNTSHAGTTTVSGGDAANDYSLVIAFVVLVASLGFLAYVIKRR